MDAAGFKRRGAYLKNEFRAAVAIAQELKPLALIVFAGATEEAAEKDLGLIGTREKHPSGAKARVDFVAITARLKSCPDTKQTFEGSSTSFTATSEVVP